MHVLIVDDNLITASAIQTQLWTQGHTATTVGSARHALDVLRMQGPHVAIVNLAAHGFDAAEAIQTLRGDPAQGRVRIIGFCGHTDQIRRSGALDAGADLVITNAQALKTLTDVMNRSPSDRSS
ncbi:MAG: response regulator [bacterium]